MAGGMPDSDTFSRPIQVKRGPELLNENRVYTHDSNHEVLRVHHLRGHVACLNSRQEYDLDRGLGIVVVQRRLLSRLIKMGLYAVDAFAVVAIRHPLRAHRARHGLAYRPKPKSKAAKKRKRLKTKIEKERKGKERQPAGLQAHLFPPKHLSRGYR